MSTVKDFIDYISARKAFLLNPNTTVFSAGEEQLIAAYLMHSDENESSFIPRTESLPQLITFDETLYSGLRTRPEYREMHAQNRKRQALAGQKGGAIRVELEEAPGSVVLRVTDNGPGVDQAARAELFESFFSTRSRDEASGLGLSVARTVVEQHGGTLALKEQDAGACFEVRLPAA